MNKLTLDSVEWKAFEIGKLFNIGKVTGEPLTKYSKGNMPYISTSATVNAVIDFVTPTINSISRKNVISIDPIGGKAFYHSYDFVGRGFSGASVNLLYNEKCNKEICLFIIKCIEKTSETRASYGNLFNSNRLRNSKLLLPIDNSGNLNWQFMENYIKQEQNKQSEKIRKYYIEKLEQLLKENLVLEDVEWKEFKMSEVFNDIQRGKRLKKSEHVYGTIPYISSTGLTNGVDGFIGNTDKIRSFENNLTIANSGSVGSCFYHEYKYVASDHVTALNIENGDKHVYLFLSTIVKRFDQKYSFNREINDKRIKKEIVILPADCNNNPNWQYMSNYMKLQELKLITKMLENIKTV